MRPVMITMKSRQKTPDNAEETELVTLGNYSKLGRLYNICPGGGR